MTTKYKSLNTFGKYTIALLAGAALPFAFAPFGIYAIAVISVGLLFFTWHQASSPRQALFLGLLFGLGYFGLGASWIYISLHTYGFMPAPLASSVTALFIVYLSLFPALQGYCCKKFFRPTTADSGTKIKHDGKLYLNLLVFPASFVLSEWLRSYLLTGFPWLLLGYSQIDSPLRNIAPLLGVYGVSFTVTFVAGCLLSLLQSTSPVIRVRLIIGIALLLFTCTELNNVKWTIPMGAPIQVSLIQGNIPQEDKWQPQKLSSILATYSSLTQKHWNSSIIVWPEAAIPTIPEQVKNFIKKLDTTAKQHNTTIITGIPLNVKTKNTENQANQESSYNAIISFGNNHDQYLKRHLVPFGEYVPLRSLLSGIINYITIPMSDFSAGPKKQPPMKGANISIAPFVCYEIAYPNLALDYMPRTQLLLTVSDDSWFGHSIAAAQQLEISRMRSLETGRYQLVSTNTGITAIIDDHGKITAQAPIFQNYVLSGRIQPTTGTTPWINFGHYLWIILVLLGLSIAKFKL